MNGFVTSMTDSTVTINGKEYSYVTPYTTASGKHLPNGAKSMVGYPPNYKIGIGDSVEYSYGVQDGVYFIKFIKKDGGEPMSAPVNNGEGANTMSKDDSIREQHCQKVVAAFLTAHPEAMEDLQEEQLNHFVKDVAKYGRELFELSRK